MDMDHCIVPIFVLTSIVFFGDHCTSDGFEVEHGGCPRFDDKANSMNYD